MTAGYSGTPLPKKLGIKEGSRVALLNAPGNFARVLGELAACCGLHGRRKLRRGTLISMKT
jgi:hypothetical protein